MIKHPKQFSLCLRYELQHLPWPVQSPDLNITITTSPVTPSLLAITLLTHLQVPVYSLPGQDFLSSAHSLLHAKYCYSSICTCHCLCSWCLLTFCHISLTIIGFMYFVLFRFLNFCLRLPFWIYCYCV